MARRLVYFNTTHNAEEVKQICDSIQSSGSPNTSQDEVALFLHIDQDEQIDIVADAIARFPSIRHISFTRMVNRPSIPENFEKIASAISLSPAPPLELDISGSFKLDARTTNTVSRLIVSGRVTSLTAEFSPMSSLLKELADLYRAISEHTSVLEKLSLYKVHRRDLLGNHRYDSGFENCLEREYEDYTNAFFKMIETPLLSIRRLHLNIGSEKRWPQLFSSLSGCKSIEDLHITNLSTSSKDFKALLFTKYRLSNFALNIRILSLCWCSVDCESTRLISDALLVPSSHTSLQELTICDDVVFGDAEIRIVAEKINDSNLSSVDLFMNHYVSIKGLETFTATVHQNHKLEGIHGSVDFMHGISPHGSRKVRERARGYVDILDNIAARNMKLKVTLFELVGRWLLKNRWE